MKNAEVSLIYYEEFSNEKEGRKLLSDLRNLLDNAKESGKKIAIVFMCRKAYYLYRLFRLQTSDWNENYSDIVIVTSRLLYKERDPRIDQCDEIIIFDDTICSGRSLKEAYIYIMKCYPGKRVSAVVAYSILKKSQLKERMPQNDETKLFLKNLIIKHQIAAEDMGRISSQEVLLFQKCRIPYVIELPLIRQAGKRPGAEWEGYTVTLAVTDFERMKDPGGFWGYVDYSYEFPDCILDVHGNTTRINSGFFVYRDSYLEKCLGKNAIQLIVKCSYEKEETGTVKAVFTPFAVMNSMLMEDAWKVFSVLYTGTDYFNIQQELYQGIKKGEREGVRQVGIALYRANVFYLSMYVFSLFKNLASKFGIDDLMVTDDVYMREIYSPEFIKVIKEIQKWETGDFLNRLYKLPALRKIEERTTTFQTIKFEHIANDVAGMVAQIRLEILRRKREAQTSSTIPSCPCLSIEEIRNYISLRLPDQNENENEMLLLGTILQMLDQSIIGNALWIKDGVIRRGFQYGENSDVVMGSFFNVYIQLLIEKFYSFCEEKSEKKNAMLLYRKTVPIFFGQLRKLKKENRVLDRYMKDQQLEYAALYYTDNYAEAEVLIQNKHCFTDMNVSATIENSLERWLEYFADSWI